MVIAALLFGYFPDQQINKAPLGVTAVERKLEAGDAELRQAKQDSEQRFDDVTKERDAPQVKVTDLEGQAAELTKQLQAPKDSAGPQDALQPPKQIARPTGTRGLASPRSTYQCGDGRTVRNPAVCRAVNTHVPGG